MTDRSLIIKKPRPVVFSLAELERYPTLEDRYAITLPFRDPAGLCYCKWYTDDCTDCELRYSEVKAKCIKRTGERWAWFSAARDLDDERGQRLGTLGYLPWEIRQEIMKLVVLHDQFDKPPSRTVSVWYPENETYTFMFADDWPNYHNMRLASPSTRVEFEHCYLTETSFTFDDPRCLEAFLDKLSIYQQSLLRTFTLELYRIMLHNDAMDGWAAVCARLPPNLVSIRFGMWPWVGVAMAETGEWLICAEPCYKVQHAIKILDILGTRARRCAARAELGLDSPYMHLRSGDPICGEWVRVLHELEPWGGDWLKWWEEATKVASDDGEAATAMA